MIDASRLTQIPLLAALPDDARAALADKLEERSIKDGERIFEEGDPGDALYFLAEGQVDIGKTLDPATGAVKTLNVLEPGDFFGEMALVNQAPRMASAVARGPAVVWRLAAGMIDEWAAGNPRVPLRVCVPFVAELNARLKRVSWEMTLLFEVGGLLARHPDPADLARGLAALWTRAFAGPVRGGCFLWNLFSREFDPAALEGPWPAPAPGSRPGTDPLFAWMADRRECALSDNWRTDDRFAPARAHWPETASLLAAPIVSAVRVEGFLVFSHGAETGFFTPFHRRTLAAVANLVGPAFESADQRMERQSMDRLRRSRQSAGF